MKDLVKRQQNHYRHSLIQPPMKASRVGRVGFHCRFLLWPPIEGLPRNPLSTVSIWVTNKTLPSHKRSFNGVSLHAQNRSVSGHLPVLNAFLVRTERVASHSHGENAHYTTCVLQPSHVTANMSPHAAQQVEIAAIRGAAEQENIPLLCTIFPFLLRPPRSLPLCLFVYVCF